MVHGEVQGVGYRYSCEHKARELGLGGWVRNREDGAVEAAFEGADDAVATMLAWARRGPRSAVVTRLEESPEEPRGETRFEIRF